MAGSPGSGCARGSSGRCAEEMALQANNNSLPSPRTSTIPRSSSLTAEPEYDFVQDPPADFYCAVSLDLLFEPHQTGCCGHHLSKAVVERLKRERKPCPMCQKASFTTHPDLYLRRKVRELQVRCQYKERECEWVGDLGNREAHQRTCPKQPWRCQHCPFNGLREAAEAHTQACEKVPVQCPNKCDIFQVARCELSDHLDRVCQLQPVPCPYSHVGCKASLTRSEIDVHVQHSEQRHLLLTCSTNLDLTRQLNEKVSQKEAEIEALKGEVARMGRELGERVQASLVVQGEWMESHQLPDTHQQQGEDNDKKGGTEEAVKKAVASEMQGLEEKLVQAVRKEQKITTSSIGTMEHKITAEVRELKIQLSTVNEKMGKMEGVWRSEKEYMASGEKSGAELGRGTHDQLPSASPPKTHHRKRVKLPKPLPDPSPSKPQPKPLLNPSPSKPDKQESNLNPSVPPFPPKLESEEDANCKPLRVTSQHSLSDINPPLALPQEHHRPPCDFKIERFSKLKDQNKEWRSPAFHSREGYKMCLGLWPNGFRSGSGTHVSVEFYKMRDVNTDRMKWNVKLPIHVRIYNYRTKKWEREHINGDTFTRSKVSGEYETSGYAQSHKFIGHDELEDYLLDDNFRIQVYKFEVKS